MIKQLTSLLLFIIPVTVTYAIISSIGTEGNHYGAPSSIGVSDSVVSRTDGK
jgi:hypothetical protein